MDTRVDLTKLTPDEVKEYLIDQASKEIDSNFPNLSSEERNFKIAELLNRNYQRLCNLLDELDNE